VAIQASEPDLSCHSFWAIALGEHGQVFAPPRDTTLMAPGGGSGGYSRDRRGQSG